MATHCTQITADPTLSASAPTLLSPRWGSHSSRNPRRIRVKPQTAKHLRNEQLMMRIVGNKYFCGCNECSGRSKGGNMLAWVNEGCRYYPNGNLSPLAPGEGAASKFGEFRNHSDVIIAARDARSSLHRFKTHNFPIWHSFVI